MRFLQIGGEQFALVDALFRMGWKGIDPGSALLL